MFAKISFILLFWAVAAVLGVPDGKYTIQDVASGNFVILSETGFGELTASVVLDIFATQFDLAAVPQGTSIKASFYGLYVTAALDGTYPLRALRAAVSTKETFEWIEQGGNNYQLRALANNDLVGTVGGELINNGRGSTYKLVPANDAPLIPPPAQGRIKNLDNNQYVKVAGDNTLLANEANAAEATVFAFERIESPDTAPLYAIKANSNNQYVTADPSGNYPLMANRGQPAGWEHFSILSYYGQFIIMHKENKQAVAVQPLLLTLQNNSNGGPDTARWVIE